MTTTPSPPPQCFRKRTKKRRSKSATRKIVWGTMIRAPFLFRPALHYVPMNITRRIFAFSLLIAPLIFSVGGGSAGKPAANRKYLVFVGTYTNKTESKGIYAYEFDADTGKLTPLNQIPSFGEDPCYLSFDKTGKYVLVANYSSGTIAVFPILADGRLGEHTAMVKDAGATGPNKERQEAPHAHWIETSPDNRFALVADLGLD